MSEEAVLNFFSGLDLKSEKVLRPPRRYANRLRLDLNISKQLLFADGIFYRRSTVPFGPRNVGH
jgi:hypothetical protein